MAKKGIAQREFYSSTFGRNPSKSKKEPIEALYERAKLWVLEYLDYCSQARSRRINQLKRFGKAYAGQGANRKTYRTREDVHFWQEYEVVETILPRIIKPFSQAAMAPFDLLMPPQIEILQKDAMVQYMHHEMLKGQITKFYLKYFRTLLIYGTAVGRVDWQKIEGTFPVLDEEGRILAFERGEKYRGLAFECPSLLNIYHDPRMDNIQESQGIIEEMLVPREKLFELEFNRQDDGEFFHDEGFYINLDELNDEGYRSQTSEDEMAPITADAASYNQTGYKKHLVHKYTGKFDYFNDRFPIECWIDLADKETIVRLQPNVLPFAPRNYIHSTLYPSQDSMRSGFYGLSLVEIANKLSISMDNLANIFIDTAKFNMNPPKEIWSMSGIDVKTLNFLEPGEPIISKVPNGMRNLQPGSTFDASQALGFLQQNLRQSTGATLSLQGMPAKSDTSATEASSLATESYAKIDLNILQLDTSMLYEIVSLSHKLLLINEVFPAIDDEMAKKEQVLDEQGNMQSVSIQRQMLEQVQDIIPIGSAQMQNRMVLLQQYYQLYGLIMKTPTMETAQGPVFRGDIDKLLKLIWTTISGRPGNEIINPAIFQQMMPQQIAGEGGGGNGQQKQVGQGQRLPPANIGQNIQNPEAGRGEGVF